MNCNHISVNTYKISSGMYNLILRACFKDASFTHISTIKPDTFVEIHISDTSIYRVIICNYGIGCHAFNVHKYENDKWNIVEVNNHTDFINLMTAIIY